MFIDIIVVFLSHQKVQFPFIQLSLYNLYILFHFFNYFFNNSTKSTKVLKAVRGHV